MVTLNIIKRGTTRTLKFQVGTHIYYMGNLIFHQEVIIVNALLALSPLILQPMVDTIIILFILRTRKMKDTKIQWIVQSYTDSKVVSPKWPYF